VYLTAPFHLEFDFSPKKYSKDGTTSYFRTHESVRLGIGGMLEFVLNRNNYFTMKSMVTKKKTNKKAISMYLISITV
jgi:hypothetical protein